MVVPFLFLPGFACPTRAYRTFLASIGEAGTVVDAHDPSGGLLAQVTGRSRPDAESGRVVTRAGDLRAGSYGAGAPLVLGGHSRGGLVAYLAAAEVQPAALVLVDPVSGGGPPWTEPDPLPTIGWTGPTLVLGCGKGGHCAPAGRNHEAFAAALIRSGADCTHEVVDDCGHADVLDGHVRTMGRLVCARGSDPDRARAGLADHVVTFLRAHGLADERMPG